LEIAPLRRYLWVLEMTFLAHLRSPKLDRDAAFDEAMREGRLPPRDRCPYCGQLIGPESSLPTPAPPAPVRTVDEELEALSNGNGRAAG
jgi:hypothetical protein